MTPEPQAKKIKCIYCGDAPVNHFGEYVGTIFAVHLEPITSKVTKHAPNFVKRLVDFMPNIVMPMLSFFRLARASNDVEKVASFRSRIIWEEAVRRGIPMEQLIIFGKPLELYRARIPGQKFLEYFESIPIPPKYLDTGVLWDDKYTLKKVLSTHGIPVPKFVQHSPFTTKSLENIFETFEKPIIVKPRVGSRGRHTTTNINTLAELKRAVKNAHTISPYVMIEEHLEGDICRATLVGGKLAGFYRASAPAVVGDGQSTLSELIEENNKTKPERVQPIEMTMEKMEYIARSGLTLQSVPKAGERIQLTHRTGRLFGGRTYEMIEELHPSFVPILEKAARTVGLAVLGFDVIVPDPTADQATQKWGIIECNTLPFIDLHYYALVGKPRNIAGMIWDLWK